MDLATLLSELAARPGTFVAWEVDQPKRRALSLFQVEGGAKQLADVLVNREELAGVMAELARLGVVAGAYDSESGIVWRAHDREFTVWGERGRLFHTDGKILSFAKQSLPFEPGMEVVAFVDKDWVQRGVRIKASQAEPLVAEHLQLRASMDDSYGALDALSDCGWTVYLGRALASFLGVQLVDLTS